MSFGGKWRIRANLVASTVFELALSNFLIYIKVWWEGSSILKMLGPEEEIYGFTVVM